MPDHIPNTHSLLNQTLHKLLIITLQQYLLAKVVNQFHIQLKFSLKRYLGMFLFLSFGGAVDSVHFGDKWANDVFEVCVDEELFELLVADFDG